MKFLILVVLCIPLIDSRTSDLTTPTLTINQELNNVLRLNSTKNKRRMANDPPSSATQYPRPFTTIGTFLTPSHPNPSISPHRSYNSSVPITAISPSTASPSYYSDNMSDSLKSATSKYRNSLSYTLPSSVFISSSASNDATMSRVLASQRPSTLSISYNVPRAPIRLRGKSVRDVAPLPASGPSTISSLSLIMSSSTDQTPNFISSLFLVPSRINNSRYEDDEESPKNDYEFFLVQNRKNNGNFDSSEFSDVKESDFASNLSFSFHRIVQNNTAIHSFKYVAKNDNLSFSPSLPSIAKSSATFNFSSTLDRAETTSSSSLKILKNRKKSLDQKLSFKNNKSAEPKDKTISSQIFRNSFKNKSAILSLPDLKSRYNVTSISNSFRNSTEAVGSPHLIMSNHSSSFLSAASAFRKAFSTLSPVHKAAFNAGVKPKPLNQQQKPPSHNPPRHLPPISFLSTSLRSSFSSHNSYPPPRSPYSSSPYSSSAHSLQETQFDPSSPTNISSQLGSSAYLPCKIRNLGNKTVSWIRSRDAHILTVDRYTFIADERFQAWHEEDSDTWTLMVKYVQERDDGRYECQVSTEPKMSRFVYFKVVSPTVRIPGGSDIHVKVGSTVSLKCVISEALKRPEYLFWYQDNERVVSSQSAGGRQIFLDRIDNDSLVGTLVIPHATPKDAGLYQCVPEKLKTANVTLHVINGEHPAAMQHGTSVMTCPGSPELLLATLTFVITLRQLNLT